MKTKDFTTTILVDQTPEEVFNAITNVHGWWSETIERSSEKLGDEFTYRHKDMHFSRQRVTDFVAGEKLSWLVTESSLNFLRNKNEWTGTTISFEIFRRGQQTQVCFTHLGLLPEAECFDACSNGWNHYLHNSLFNLITTGKGNPDRNESIPQTKMETEKSSVNN